MNNQNQTTELEIAAKQIELPALVTVGSKEISLEHARKETVTFNHNKQDYIVDMPLGQKDSVLRAGLKASGLKGAAVTKAILGVRNCKANSTLFDAEVSRTRSDNLQFSHVEEMKSGMRKLILVPERKKQATAKKELTPEAAMKLLNITPEQLAVLQGMEAGNNA